MNHVAIDLHDQYSQICVMNQAREILVEAKVPTTRPALSDFFRQRERSLVIYGQDLTRCGCANSSWN